jgi:hypothetical protein
MIIRSSDVTMRSSHLHEWSRSSETSVRTWGGSPDRSVPDTALRAPRVGVRSEDLLGEPFQAGREPSGKDATAEAGRTVSARFASLIALVEKLTGERVRVMDPSDLSAPASRGDALPEASPAAHRRSVASGGPSGAGGFGMEIVVTRTEHEVEATGVEIAASVTTADGRRLDVGVDLEMYQELARSVRAGLTVGAPEPKDPLVLSFGTVPSLTSERVDLDLDGDGAAESLPFVGDGLAYLAIDRDGDGAVSGGEELFGPRSGDGFSELAAYDVDGNGWIDEGDPVFGQLRLWGSPEGGLVSLADRGVGAIGLANIASPFTLRGGGEVLGQMRSTGLWLGENGTAGTVHQVDVVS